MKSPLDERMGVNVDITHPVIARMCEFVSNLMNRKEVAADGKTAYEDEKGLWKHRLGRTMEKLKARWSCGLFVGGKVKSNKLIIVDQDTKMLKYVRTVRRMPGNQRWVPPNVAWVGVVPWNRGEGDRDADGDVPEFDVKSGPGRKLTEEIAMNEVPKIVHRAHLRKLDLERHGQVPWVCSDDSMCNRIRKHAVQGWRQSWRTT